MPIEIVTNLYISLQLLILYINIHFRTVARNSGFSACIPKRFHNSCRAPNARCTRVCFFCFRQTTLLGWSCSNETTTARPNTRERPLFLEYNKILKINKFYTKHAYIRSYGIRLTYSKSNSAGQ